VKAAVVAVCAVLLLAGCGGSKHASFDGTALSPPVAAPSFTLHDDAGRALSLASQRGHYVVVTFLYVHCPDVCPVIAGTLNRVLATPAARRAGLRVLAVSVDPKGDTPAAVRNFVAEHRLAPSFHYLIGTRSELAPVWKGFHVASTGGPNATVSHSAFEVLVDPQGKERVIYDSNVTAAQIVHDLRELA